MASKLLVFLLLAFPLQGDPWGKDSDLVDIRKEPQKACSPTGPGSKLIMGLIYFHQKVISPADGPRSHFYPSSSQYMKDALRKYGFPKGYLYGCDRLMRENDERWLYPVIPSKETGLLKWNPVK